MASSILWGNPLALNSSKDIGKIKTTLTSTGVNPIGQNIPNTQFSKEYEEEKARYKQKLDTTLKGESKMVGMTDKVVNSNTKTAKSAAFLEAGRIANNQLNKVVVKKVPMMLQGYIKTPAGKLVLANLVSMAVMQFKPNNIKLNTLAEAMMVNAWAEVYQMIDVEELIDNLLSNEAVKTAINSVTDEK